MKTFFGTDANSDFGKIIAMDRFDSGRSLSPIRQAEAYWTALLTGGEVPMRSQIDPRGLENILEYTFVLERIAPGLARFRLAGSHLTKLAGMEVRGMPLTAYFEPSARGAVTRHLDRVFSQPAIAELGLVSSGKLGRAKLQARMLLLPLKSDLGDISRALGVLVSDGPIVSTPRRFTIAENKIRTVHDIQKPPVRSGLQNMGLAEEQAEFKSAPPHLRLVSSRDD
ncbi:PAS domain-containing protein [Ruegeria arenilitoris]|nr:PAS domain-containing protein [Ruegeria arenilitoris]